MNLIEKITKIDKIFAWSFLGVLFTVILFIYQEYYKKDFTEITFQILAKNKVIDVKEDIKDLKILYKENELLSQNKELKIINIKLNNTGTQNITQDKYDRTIDWGINIENAIILNIPEIKSTSSQYVFDNFSKMKIDSNKIYFPKLIFDCGAYVELKILVVTKAGVSLNPILFGKISGIDNFKYIEEKDIVSTSPEKNKSFFGKLFAILSPIGGVLLILLLGGLIFDTISNRWNKYIKKSIDDNLIDNFKSKYTDSLNESHEFIFQMLRNHDVSFLNMANDLLNTDNELLKELIFIDYIEKNKLKKIEDSAFANVKMTSSLKLKDYVQQYPKNSDIINSMLKHSFIKIEYQENKPKSFNDDSDQYFTVHINHNLNDALKEFLAFQKFNS